MVPVTYRDGVSVSGEGVQVDTCLHIPDMDDLITATTYLNVKNGSKRVKWTLKSSHWSLVGQNFNRKYTLILH